jgi:hypothetical protein
MSIYVHFYDDKTGLFTGVSMHTNLSDPKAVKRFIAENTPAGHGAYVGYADALSQRMDLASGQVIDYKPPQPSPRHEWNAVTKRWQKQAAMNRSAALARIADLEKGQHRTVRETLIRACHAVDAIKESLAPESQPVRDAVDRMYAALSRLELLETELGNLRADL